MPKHTILCSLILITLFIPLDTTSGAFYGTNSLKPLVDKDTINILLPGGTKSLVNNNNNTTYLTNDHVGSVRLALNTCLLYTSPSPRDRTRSRMPSSA